MVYNNSVTSHVAYLIGYIIVKLFRYLVWSSKVEQFGLMLGYLVYLL